MEYEYYYIFLCCCVPLLLRGEINISQLQGEFEFNTFLFDKRLLALIHSLNQHNVSFRDSGGTPNDVLLGWVECLDRSFTILA